MGTEYASLRAALRDHEARRDTDKLMEWMLDTKTTTQMSAFLREIGADARPERVLAVLFLKLECFNVLQESRSEDTTMLSEAQLFWEIFMSGKARDHHVERAIRFRDAWAALDYSEHRQIERSRLPRE